MLAVGQEHMLAITTTEERFSWGKGESGQLGNGSTEGSFEPVKVSLKHAVYCSAGDDHSACISRVFLPSFSEGVHRLYTWGSCDMGKLGVPTNNMKEIAYPMVVERLTKHPDDKTHPILVSCGWYHTMAVYAAPDSDQAEGRPKGNLWGWGGGWFGRLGTGDQENQELPVPIQIQQTMYVACGPYHTAVVAASEGGRDATCGDLWLCGRNKSVLEPEHWLTPKKFSNIDGQMKIQSVAVAEFQTMILTQNHELLVFGDNKNGQLGIGSGQATVNIPEVVKALPGSVELVACSSSHAVVYLDNQETFAWGDQGCGSLGLVEKRKDRLVDEPARVRATWATLEAMSGIADTGKRAEAEAEKQEHEEEEEEEDEEDEDEDEEDGEDTAEAAQKDDKPKQEEQSVVQLLHAIRAGQKVEHFSTMQALLKQEPREAKVAALKKKEDELVKKLEGEIEQIKQIPEKERELVRLQGDLEQSFNANLHLFQKLVSPDFVHLFSETIAPKLGFYEELLNAMPLQPCYLSSLSTCIINMGSELATFHEIIRDIFLDIADERTLYQLLALAKHTIKKEIAEMKSVEGLFMPEGSAVFGVMKDFSLHSMNYKKIIHPIMDTKRGKDARDTQRGNNAIDSMSTDITILKAVVDVTQNDQIFAFTVEDLKNNPTEKFKDLLDPQDLQSELNNSIEKFKNFMNNDFMQALHKLAIEDNLKKMFKYIVQEVRSEPLADASKDGDRAGLSAALRVRLPLLKIFVLGILVPLLQNPKKYASKEVGLYRCEPEFQNNPILEHNSRQLALFLETMAYDKYNEKGSERQMFQIAKTTRKGILRYLQLQEQAKGVTDDVYTQLLIHTLAAHWDRGRTFVSMPTPRLMYFSNMLNDFEGRIRLNEDDVVQTLCQKIGRWSQEDIERAEANPVIHNFNINVRFLLKEGTLTTCKVSQCPMPPSLSASTSKAEQSDSRFIDTVNLQDNQWHNFEQLFLQMKTVHATSFAGLREELDKKLDECRSSKAQPNFELAKCISEAKKKLEELIALEQGPADVLKSMTEVFMMRDNYKVYLEQIEAGLDKLSKAKADYSNIVQKAEVQIREALRVSQKLEVPAKLKELAENNNIILKFTQLDSKIKKYVDDFGRQSNVPGCSFAPLTKVSYTQLKKDKVLTDATGPVKDQAILAKLSFTFYLINGGCEIVVSYAKHTVQQMNIPPEKMRQLRHSDESLVLPESDKIDKKYQFHFNSTKLIALLTKMSNKLG